MRRYAAALVIVAISTWLSPAQAQIAGGLDGNAAIAVEADKGIEWRRDEKIFVARGNAVAKQGEVTVRADQLTARYRESKSGSTQVYSVEATGKVRITSGDNSVEGDRGVYDLETEEMTVTGKPVVFVAPDQKVVAEQSMTFDNKKQVATARGNATVTRGDQRIRADLLKAFFRKDPQGKTTINRVEGFGNVHVSTPTEIARANKGTYDLAAGKATLSGSVRITRGADQFNGENAEIDLRGGVSNLTGTPGDADGRVRALIVPRRSSGSGRKAEGS